MVPAPVPVPRVLSVCDIPRPRAETVPVEPRAVAQAHPVPLPPERLRALLAG